MPKPATVPTWNTDATNRTTPSAGQQASGYAVDAVPTSGEFNWLLFWLAEWVAYLDAATIDGDLIVEGALEVLGGNVTLSDGTVANGGGDPVNFPDGIVTAGDYYFTTPKTMVIGPTEFFENEPTHTHGPDFWILGADPELVQIPIKLPAGAQIVDYRLYIQKNTDGDQEIGCSVVESVNGVATGVGSSSSNSDNAPGNITLSPAAQTIDIVANRSYRVEVEFTGLNAPAPDRIYGLAIDWIMPPP